MYDDTLLNGIFNIPSDIPSDIPDEIDEIDGYKTPPSEYLPFPYMGDLPKKPFRSPPELYPPGLFPPGLFPPGLSPPGLSLHGLSPPLRQPLSPPLSPQKNHLNRDYLITFINLNDLHCIPYKNLYDILTIPRCLKNTDMLNNWLNQILNNTTDEYNKNISNWVKNNFTRSDITSYVPLYLCRDIHVFRKIDADNCTLITITIDEKMNHETLLKLLLENGFVKHIDLSMTFKKKKDSKYLFLASEFGMVQSIAEISVHFM